MKCPEVTFHDEVYKIGFYLQVATFASKKATITYFRDLDAVILLDKRAGIVDL